MVARRPTGQRRRPSRRVRTAARRRKRRLVRGFLAVTTISALTGAAFAYEELLPASGDPAAIDADALASALESRIDRPPARATVPTRAPVPTATPTATSTPTPTVAPTATPTPTESKITIPKQGSGSFVTASGESGKPDRSRVVHYRVEVEKELPFDAAEVAEEVHAALVDERGWGADGKTGFQRVSGKSYDVRVLIATPATTDKLCYPLLTQGWKSCRIGDKVVLNADRWAFGVEDYAGHLDLYRIYLANHEMGHFLGHGHVDCPGPGKLAPVMMQQTKGIGECKINPWPFPNG